MGCVKLVLEVDLTKSTTSLLFDYINRLLFLVVQVDIILNSCLWIHLSPIPELQYTFLPPKCYKLGIVPQLFSSFVVFILRPTFGSFEEFGGALICMCSHYNWLIIQRFFNLWNKTIHIWIFMCYFNNCVFIYCPYTNFFSSATSLNIELKRYNLTSFFLIKGTRMRIVLRNWYWFATNLLQVAKCKQGLLTSSIHLPKAKKWLLNPCDTHYSVKKKPCSLLPTL